MIMNPDYTHAYETPGEIHLLVIPKNSNTFWQLHVFLVPFTISCHMHFISKAESKLQNEFYLIKIRCSYQKL